MTARKTSKKTTGKAAASRGSKASKVSKKKAPARKKAAASPKKTAKKAAAPARKARAAKPPAKPKPKPVAAPPAAPARKAASGGPSSLAVNMGHVFALRPRVPTSFRPADFLTARQQLSEESYESLAAAAQAVAEKALELTHEQGSRRGRKRDR